MEREVRYCTTEDGVHIAYCVEGEGSPLVVVPYLVESFSLDNLIPELQAFMRQLGTGRQLIRYDMRGTGLSQRDVADISPVALVRDLAAVVKAARLQRFALWAQTIGGPRAIEYAASHPNQVSRLILFGTYARGTHVMPPENLQALAAMSRTNWPLASQVLADMAGRREFPESLVGAATMFQQSSTGDVGARALEAAYASDVTEVVPTVKAETLVLHRMGDPIFPFAGAQSMAALIPQARFVPLEGTVHIAFLGDSQAVIEAVNAFLNEEESRAEAQRPPEEPVPLTGFRTVLFTDVVAHTEMMQRLGDERGREVLREHEQITREVLKSHGGREVKTMGDGFMASFGSVTKAVECAIVLQRAFDERNRGVGAGGSRTAPTREVVPVHIRIGLNAGEPIEEEGPDGRSDLFGATVILAARIAAQAEGGEILASMAVRELCAGKGFLFADRGEHAMRGFEDPARVFEIRWRE